MADITIPPAALEAGARALAIAKEGNDEWWTLHMRATRSACRAMLESWPGMQHDNYVIVIPLTEKTDDKA